MKTAADRIRVVDKLRDQHPDKSPEEITDMADLVARTHPQFRRGRQRSMLLQALPWIVAAVAALVATKEAKCQTTTIYIENGGTQQAGGPGTYRFNCDGSTVICNWNPANRTWTVTSAGGGGSPGGSPCELQYNASGAFGGTTSICFDDSTAWLDIAPSVTIPAAGGVYAAVSDTFNITASGLTAGNVFVNSGLLLGMNFTAPANAADANSGLNVINYVITVNTDDTLNFINGFNGNVYMNGTAVVGSIQGYQSRVVLGDTSSATQYAVGGYSYESNQTGVTIPGYEAALELAACSGQGASAGNSQYCADLLLDDPGAATDPTSGNPVYTIYSPSTTAPAVFAGPLAVDGTLTASGSFVFQGFTCALVASVMTCT